MLNLCNNDDDVELQELMTDSSEIAEAMMKASMVNVENVIQAAMLERVAQVHVKRRDKLSSKADRMTRAEDREQNADKKRGMRAMARKTHGPSTPPLLFVKRDGHGGEDKPAGTYTTAPDEIDGIVRRTWRKIYDGNAKDPGLLVKTFMSKYVRQIFTSKAYDVQDVTTQAVYDVFKHGKKSAAGLDSWEPEELSLMSWEACAWTAALYRMIENGASWPQGTQHARAAFLEKDGSVPGEVQSYRILLIMSALYRKWATMRLRDLEGWVAQWALPEMYAGVGCQGAADAWYQILIDIEELRLDEQCFCCP